MTIDPHMIQNANGIRKYIKGWDIPHIVNETNGKIEVKMPGHCISMVGILVKAHSTEDLNSRVSFTPLSLKERIKLLLS